MTAVARIVLGLALGALLGMLPFLHYRYGAGHSHGPTADTTELHHAAHTH